MPKITLPKIKHPPCEEQLSKKKRKKKVGFQTAKSRLSVKKIHMGEDLLAAQSRAAVRLNQTLMRITNAMSQQLLEVFALLQTLLVQT